MNNFSLEELSPPRFPRRLREIADPPKKIYVRGTLPPEEHTWLAVVGSRKASSYGREVTERLISGLRGYPVVIVSGLALGIDALAHRAAHEAGLSCVGVPGSGLNPKVLYPALNRQLAERIIERGGALLSEFEPDFQATAWSFPQRNRIMAGLSDAVLVVEAEKRSGTLITARLATEYNRDVLTVPGSIFSSTSEGPHLLIRLGATPITSPEELLEALGFEPSKKIEKDYSECSPEELTIIQLLTQPLSRDELFEQLALPVSHVNALLSGMEIKGLIKEVSGEIHRA